LLQKSLMARAIDDSLALTRFAAEAGDPPNSPHQRTSGEDPVEGGLVSSLNQPCGNVTGVSLAGAFFLGDDVHE